MLSTKLYKKVHELAEALLEASQRDDTFLFARLYAELNTLCEENEDSEKNHPVQWETLADFTEDSDDALVLYQKALAYAEADSAYDYIASINYAIAVLLRDCGNLPGALAAAYQANEQVDNIGDDTLKQEISDLIAELQ